MAFINWNDTLDLGIAEIDREHRELADAVNELYVKAKDAAGYDELKGIIADIMQRIEAHFATEERIFKEYGYPEATTHAKLHRTLEDQLRALQRQIEEGGLPFSDTVLTYVKDWFLTHTTGSDLVYAVWMKSRGFIHPETKELIHRK